MPSFQGKVIALTGGASGMGFETAKWLASEGASLVIGDINKQGLSSAKDSIQAAGNDSVEIFVVDIRDRSAVRAFLEYAKSRFGRLDGCAFIAGAIGKNMNIHHIWELDNSEYDFIMSVNATGLFNCLAEALRPGMLSDGGSIVTASSICGLRGLARSSAYCGSKHAVIGLSRAAAIEAGPRNIRVNCVAPGAVGTPMLAASNVPEDVQSALPSTPLPRIGKPSELAKVFAFLLSEESSFVTGAVYSVDGGWNC